MDFFLKYFGFPEVVYEYCLCIHPNWRWPYHSHSKKSIQFRKVGEGRGKTMAMKELVISPTRFMEPTFIHPPNQNHRKNLINN